MRRISLSSTSLLSLALLGFAWWHAPVLRASAPGYEDAWTGGDLVAYWYVHNRLAAISGQPKLWTPAQAMQMLTRQAWLAVLVPHPPVSPAALQLAYPGLWKSLTAQIGATRMQRLVQLPARRQAALRQAYGVLSALPATKLLDAARQQGLVPAAAQAGLPRRGVWVATAPNGPGPVWLLHDAHRFYVVSHPTPAGTGYSLTAVILTPPSPAAWLARLEARHPLQTQRTWFGLF